MDLASTEFVVKKDSFYLKSCTDVIDHQIDEEGKRILETRKYRGHGPYEKKERFLPPNI